MNAEHRSANGWSHPIGIGLRALRAVAVGILVACVVWAALPTSEALARFPDHRTRTTEPTSTAARDAQRLEKPAQQPAAEPGPTASQVAQPGYLRPIPAMPTADDSTHSQFSHQLSQPDYLAPGDMLIVSDSDQFDGAPDEEVQAEPRLAEKTHGKPAGLSWSSIWQQLFGGGVDRNSGAPPNAALASATEAAGRNALEQPGGELFRQLLGADTGQSTSTTPSGSQGASALAAGTTRTAVGTPRPALSQASLERDADERATVSTARYDADPLWSQLGLSDRSTASRGNRDTSAGSRTGAPSGAATGSRADSMRSSTAHGRAHNSQASRGSQEGVWDALWRPMTMTNDEAPAPTPASQPKSTTSAEPPRQRRPESERVPRLLAPFYATQNPGAGPTGNASAEAPSADAVRDSSLLRQLALSSNEDLQAAVEGRAGRSASSRPLTLEESWASAWPALARPFTLTEEPGSPFAPAGDVIQVAYQEETLPAPGTVRPDDLSLPGEDGTNGSENGDDAANGENKEGALAEAEKLGDEPEDNSLQFLRTSTVLLEPGEFQFDIGLEYTLAQTEFPILLTSGMLIQGVDDVDLRVRELVVPMELRFGLLRRVQLFLQVPVGWSNVQASLTGFDTYVNDGGLGDISFGATAQLQDATKDQPYVIGTMAVTAPTGGDPFTNIASPSTTGPSLGNGFWAVAGNLTVIRIYDPVVVYYGLGARGQFGRHYAGLDIQPGMEYNYTLGLGFAVNEKVTLSTQFFGAYVDDLDVDGERVEGSKQEPISLRMAATFSKPCKRLVEPFVAFGLTDDAVDTNFGITWTF